MTDPKDPLTALLREGEKAKKNAGCKKCVFHAGMCDCGIAFGLTDYKTAEFDRALREIVERQQKALEYYSQVVNWHRMSEETCGEEARRCNEEIAEIARKALQEMWK